MSETFRRYARNGFAEARPYRAGEVLPPEVSISDVDKINGSPKVGDMIARDPDNHADQWLIAADYFAKNYREE